MRRENKNKKNRAGDRVQIKETTRDRGREPLNRGQNKQNGGQETGDRRLGRWRTGLTECLEFQLQTYEGNDQNNVTW